MKQRRDQWQNFYALKRTPPGQPTMKFRGEKRKRTDPYNPDFIDACVHLWKSGLSQEKISQQLGCALSSVSKALKARGLARR